MKSLPTRIALLLALACAGLPAHAQEAPKAAQAAATAASTVAPSGLPVERSVIKIFSTLSRPDLFRPWAKSPPQDVTGSGVVIEGKRILTNAHVVGYASRVEVQASEAGDKVGATVVAIAPDIDLALLKLDDDAFFDKHPAVRRASVLPEVRDQVFAYGYPMGGNALSITKGIVSRVEFVPYSFGSTALRVQIDAPINPGNSGGPVMAGDKMIGLAFSLAVNAQNIGYVIPNEEIELFLHDAATGRHQVKPTLGDDVQTLENPDLRQYLKLDRSVEGIVVRRPAQAEGAYPLKEWDVITKIGDDPIDNQGMVRLGPNLRVNYRYRVRQLSRDGKVALTVVRGGKSMQVQVPVGGPRPLLITDLKGGYPSYFVWGPIVFSRATAELAGAIGANAMAVQALAFNASPLVTHRGDEPDAQHDELVVVCSPFFPHKLVAGYGNHFGAVVESVNGVPVRSLRNLVTLLRDQNDDFVVLRFDQRFGETMVLPRKAMLDATEGILSDNNIRSQGSPDMMQVWNGKKT